MSSVPFATVATLITSIIGVLILIGKADIRTIAWYYVISGAMSLLVLIVVGVLAVFNETGNK